MQNPILIDGVPFFAVSHHDGRFMRAPGLAALARRDPDGGYTILSLELCEAINRSIGPQHPRWSWALAQGLDTLLVHLAGQATAAPDAAAIAGAPAVRWHAGAQAPLDDETAPDAPRRRNPA